MVSFGVAGTVDRVFAVDGSAVDSGQILALLDTTDLRSQVSMGEAALDGAAATLSDLEVGHRSQEIASAAAALSQAQAVAGQASEDLRRQSALYDQGAISEREYQAAVTARQVADAGVGQASSHLSLMTEGYAEGQIGAAAAAVRQAAASLDLARSRLAQATLESPFGGVVLEHFVEPGEYATPGAPAFDVAYLDSVRLMAWIDEPLLGRVSIGTRASVTCDSWPGETFPGTVTWISREAEFTPTQVQIEDERATLVYEIRIDMDNREGKLLPGMPAQAVLELRPE